MISIHAIPLNPWVEKNQPALLYWRLHSNISVWNGLCRGLGGIKVRISQLIISNYE